MVSHTRTHTHTSLENVFQDTVIISSTIKKSNCIPSAALKADGMGNTGRAEKIKGCEVIKMKILALKLKKKGEK